MLERIWTRDGTVHRVVMTWPPEEKYHERITDQYNEYQELEWRKTENLHNGKFLTVYHFGGKPVGQVLADSDYSFQIARNGNDDPIVQGFNDFEPRVSGDPEEWKQFINKNFLLSNKLYPEEPILFCVAAWSTPMEWWKRWNGPIPARKIARRRLSLSA
jgi:hypothetical protein